MSQSDYTVNIIVTTTDNTSAAARAASKSMDGMARSALKAKKSLFTLADAAKTLAIGYAAMRLAQKGIEFVKLGANVEAAAHRLEAFAGGANEAARMLKALQIGTDFTIDRMTAMAQASTMLEIGMVRNTREMELAGAIVAKLGRQTMSTEARMQRLTLLLANQSVKRLDDFGLSVERVRERQQALEKQGLSTEAAFRGAVFAEAEQKLALLGDTSELTAVSIQKVTAAWNTLKQTFAEAIAVSVGIDMLNKIADVLNRLTSEYQGAVEGIAKARELGLKRQDFDQYVFAYHEAAKAASVWQGDEEELRVSLEAKNVALRESTVEAGGYTDAMVASMSALGMTGQATQEYVQTLWQTRHAADGFTEAVLGSVPSLREQAQAAMQSSFAMQDLASSYAMYQQQTAISYGDYAGSMSEIEARYQESIKSISAGGGGGGGGGGRAAGREFDRADIERGLKIQRLQLEEYEKQRAEFGKVDEDTEPVFWHELAREDRKWLMESGKTLDDLKLKREDAIDEVTELEKAQMDDRVEDLKKQIGETQRILEQGHWDQHTSRMAAAQRDTSALLQAAKDRRDKELAALQKTQARQETMRVQSLGRIKLAAFENWVEMNIDTDDMTQEQADMIAGMRQSIMIEYGLLTQEAIEKTEMWESSFDNLWTTLQTGAKESVTELDKVIQKLNEMPDEKVIKIRYELSEEPEDIPGRQHGGGVRAGMPYLVGEGGPELFVPGSSGSVVNNSRTEQMIGSNNTYNINDARAMAFLAAKERAQVRSEFAAASGM